MACNHISSVKQTASMKPVYAQTQIIWNTFMSQQFSFSFRQATVVFAKMHLPISQYLLRLEPLSTSQPSAACHQSVSLGLQAEKQYSYHSYLVRQVHKIKLIVRCKIHTSTQIISMPGTWQEPEPNDYDSFIQRSQSNEERATKTEPVKQKSSKSASTSPMPLPKDRDSFGAWREYLGSEKDEQIVEWKKRQLGEVQNTTQDRVDNKKPQQTSRSNNAKKENRMLRGQTDQKGTHQASRGTQALNQGTSTDTKAVKKD